MASAQKLFFVLAALLVLLPSAALLLRWLARSKPSAPWPYHVKPLLSQPEQVLFHRLVKALSEHIVMSQVQVSRVLGVNKGFNFREWNNRIDRLSYDFVICASDTSVLAVIELDDATHEGRARAATDAKKDKATADGGLRMIRWHVRSLPDQATIGAEFARTLPLPADPGRRPAK